MRKHCCDRHVSSSEPARSAPTSVPTDGGSECRSAEHPSRAGRCAGLSRVPRSESVRSRTLDLQAQHATVCWCAEERRGMRQKNEPGSGSWAELHRQQASLNAPRESARTLKERAALAPGRPVGPSSLPREPGPAEIALAPRRYTIFHDAPLRSSARTRAGIPALEGNKIVQAGQSG
jgi:hypothetical protein